VNGVDRMTIYDPWSQLLNNVNELTTMVNERKNNRRRVTVFAAGDEEEEAGDMQVAVLGREHGRPAMVTVCKQLCHLPSTEITTEMISTSLAKLGIREPDCLIQIGGVPSMAGFPPWAMRCSEIFPIGQLRRVNEGEFQRLMEKFSSRDQRNGR